MSPPKGLASAFAIARIAIVLALLPHALGWRSPFLASIRVWAFVGLTAIPLVIMVAEIRTLRRVSGRGGAGTESSPVKSDVTTVGAKAACEDIHERALARAIFAD